MKIFLAEDDMNIVTIAKMALEKLGGHKVEVVNDGLSALDRLLKGGDWDVVLLDEMMPKMNGREVLQRYQAQCPTPLPVIFMSANTRNLENEPLSFPEIGYIPKPFDPMSLGQRIEECLQKHCQEQKAV